MAKIGYKTLVMMATLWALIALPSCSDEPHATDLEFGYTTFDCEEGAENGYVSVYLMYTPYKYPVLVDVDVEMLTGKDHLGNDLTLDDVLEFDVTDKPYTVTKTGDRTAKIENIEVTYTNYNQKITFKSHDNDFLQSETITIEFTLTKVEGSEMGSNKSAILTITDDEKAPLVRVGYYDTRYTSPADATSTEKGQFYMSLQKVGKYEYVASGLFGLERPRLLGIFDPEAKTITFDGTDYDQILWKMENPVNAFRNDTIWAASYEDGRISEILRLRGAGADGTEPIVMTTEEIAENSRGVILSIDTPCGFDIYDFDAESNKATGSAKGTYDAMERSESMTFSDTNYPKETRTTVAHPTRIGGWKINR